MITTGYGICVVIAVLATLIMALRDYDHIGINDWSVALLLPILIMAHWLKVQVSTAEAGLVLFAFIELMTSMMLAVMLFSMLHGIGARVRLWAKAVVYGAVAALLFPIWEIFNKRFDTGIIEITDTGDGYVSRMIGVFNAYEHYSCLMAFVLLIACVIVLIRSKRRKFSRSTFLSYKKSVFP